MKSTSFSLQALNIFFFFLNRNNYFSPLSESHPRIVPVKFLLDYPELIGFNIKHAYFNDIKKKLSKEEFLFKNRVAILNDSIFQLIKLLQDDFLKTF